MRNIRSDDPKRDGLRYNLTATKISETLPMHISANMFMLK